MKNRHICFFLDQCFLYNRVELLNCDRVAVASPEFLSLTEGFLGIASVCLALAVWRFYNTSLGRLCHARSSQVNINLFQETWKIHLLQAFKIKITTIKKEMNFKSWKDGRHTNTSQKHRAHKICTLFTSPSFTVRHTHTHPTLSQLCVLNPKMT
jgi:hypothetical protein